MATGCRTVWVHPEATGERYGGDFYRCRYGVDPQTAREAAALPRARPDWKLCMLERGWTTRVGTRDSPPWDTPRAPRSGKRGVRRGY